MEQLDYLKIASGIHDSVKNSILNEIETNSTTSLLQLRNFIQSKILNELTKLENVIVKGLAFPIGLSGDSIVAHYTPINTSYNLKETLPYYLNPDTGIDKFKILKIDYGIHLEGHIIDKAFSINIKSRDLELLLISASKEAVDCLKKNIGVDARLNELASTACEIVKSYEFNETPLKIVDNVYSHNILPWKIHGDKFIKPDFKNYNEDLKVECGEQYAIEIYTSNGDGTAQLVKSPITHSHYRLKSEKSPILPDKELNDLVDVTKKHFRSLPFCPNMINIFNLKINKKKPSHQKIITLCQTLQTYNIVESYPPIIELDSNCSVAQIEDNVYIESNESKIYL